MIKYKTSCMFLVLLLFIGCFDIAGECETTISRRIPNPEKTLQVVTDVTDCGATTTPTYGVRIIEGIDTTDEGTRENTIPGSSFV